MDGLLRWSLVSSVVLIVACGFDNRSDAFACDQTGVCDGVRQCVDGWCVLPGGGNIDSGIPRPDAEALPCGMQCDSCNGDGCVIDCSISGSCPDDIECPAGVPCEVDCGSGSCAGDIDCSDATDCTIDCGAGACDGDIDCGTGACDVDCSGQNSCTGEIDCIDSATCAIDCGGSGSCDNDIRCRDGPCTVACTGQSSCANGVNCTDACACDTQCTGQNSCSGGNDCPTDCELGLECSSTAGVDCNTCP